MQGSGACLRFECAQDRGQIDGLGFQGIQKVPLLPYPGSELTER